MMVMIREGTSAKNLEALVPLVNPKNSRRFCLVTDDLHPEDLVKKGHLDHVLRKAVRLGLDPVTALQMVTLNPAEFFRLRGRGAVPGTERTWRSWKPELSVEGSTRTAALSLWREDLSFPKWGRVSLMAVRILLSGQDTGEGPASHRDPGRYLPGASRGVFLQGMVIGHPGDILK
jgi:hypothetical protein